MDAAVLIDLLNGQETKETETTKIENEKIVWK